MHKNRKTIDTLPTNTNKTNRKTYTLQQQLLLLKYKNKNKPTRKLTLITIQIILFEIPQSRNNNKYDKNLTLQHTIINKINSQLQNNLQAHYKKHKLNETLYQFKDQFCINEAIAKTENNSLITTIT